MSLIGTSKNWWPFSPQSIPGLSLWLDAADSSTVTGTSSVTAWRDKSGNGKNATATGTTITTSTLNGLPAINYSGASWLTAPVTSGVADPFTIFAVFNATYPINGPLYTTNTTTDGNGFFFDLAATSDSTTTLNDFLPLGGSFQTNANSTFRGNITYVVSIVSTSVNGGSITLFRNGTSYMSGTTTGNFTWTSFLIGKRNIPSVPYTDQFAGKFGEFIIFNSALSTSQRQQVEGYLAVKWGLQSSLLSTHPYNATSTTQNYQRPLFQRIFSPVDIPGCQLWLDAADSSSLTLSGSSITQWKDKSGNGNNFTTVAGTLTYTTTTIGKPGIFFPSGGAGMTSANNASLNGNSSRTYFFVADVPSSCRALIGTGPHTVTSPPNTFGFDSAKSIGSPTIWSPYVYGAGDQTFTPVASTTTINYAAFDSATSTIYGNYNTTSSDSTRTSTTLNTSASLWYLGNRPDGATPVNSYVCEFLEFNTFLSTSQRQQVEQYLANKWGLVVNLPTGHPGKLLPAFSTIFTPKSISGLSLWLDGSDTNSMVFSSGTNMSQWSDKSGNGNHGLGRSGNGTSISTTGGPNYVSTTNGVTFDSNQFFITSGLTVAAQTHCLIAVHNPTITNGDGTGNTRIFSFQNLGTLVAFPYMNGTIPRGYIGSVSGAPAYNTSTLVENSVAGQKNLIIANISATSQFIYKNGAVQTSATFSLGSATTDILSIGKEYRSTIGDAYEGYQGTIHEMLIFNTALTDSQRQQVEGYLAWKWGPQISLPDTHAFKKFRP